MGTADRVNVIDVVESPGAPNHTDIGLATSRDCEVCTERRPVEEFPNHGHFDTSHSICQTCTSIWIENVVQSRDEIRGPSATCTAVLTDEEVG
jgi:hypothetical protein